MIKRNITKGQEKLINNSFLDQLGESKQDLKLSATGKLLIDLAGGVMEDAAENLRTKKATVTGNLSRDMDQEITTDGRFLETIVKILEYGKYLDEGVDGTKKSRGSRFSFKNQFVSREFMQSIRKWAIRRNLASSAFKKKIGNETETRIASNEEAAFLIARNIKRNGIEPRKFMTDAIAKLQTKLTDDKVLAAFKIDVIAALPDGSEFR